MTTSRSYRMPGTRTNRGLRWLVVVVLLLFAASTVLPDYSPNLDAGLSELIEISAEETACDKEGTGEEADFPHYLHTRSAISRVSNRWLITGYAVACTWASPYLARAIRPPEQ